MNDSTPVLLVEDDPDDAALIEHAFKEAGIVNPLIVVADGEKAMEAGVLIDFASAPNSGTCITIRIQE